VSDDEPTPYADNALAHFDKGWAVFPATPRGKSPLVKGRSGGYKSQPAARVTVERELRRFARANVGIRVPGNMVVLDIDLKKEVDEETGEIKTIDGYESFLHLGLSATIGVAHDAEAEHGSVRGVDEANLYRHHLYRVPDGVTPEDIARLGASRDGIDLIRWTHRLTLGRGSLHKSGERYRWVTKAGKISHGIPTPEHATRLSTGEWDAIVEFFGTSSGSGFYEAGDVDVEEWMEAHDGSPSGRLRGAFRKNWTERTGGRHDAALRAVQQVCHLAEEGEVGAARVIARIERVFVEQVADRSDADEAHEEFARILTSAIGKAVSKTESGDREDEKIPEVTTIELPKGVVRWYDEQTKTVKTSTEPPETIEVETVEVELNEEFSDTLVAMKIHSDWAEKGRHIISSPGLGWLRWDGKRWRPLDGKVVADAVQKYIKDWFLREVESGCSSERRGRLGALMSKPRQERLVRALEVVEVVEATEFDRDHHLLNVQNGVVDLRTGALLPHDAARRMTKICRVAYKPGARHPDWTKAKGGLDVERRSYLLSRFGQACSGYTPTDDKVVFLTGPGGNGKSTIVMPVLKALGSYAALVPPTLLMGASDRHPAELMTLLGVRFALAEETPEEGRINVQRLKQIAGVAEMTARKMRQDFVTFEQTHSLFVTTNYPPNVVETDHGTWRRLERVRFERNFRADLAEGEEVDQTLSQRVASDPEVWEAVLADLVEYAVSFFQNNKVMEQPPEEIKRDTMMWRSDMDPLIEFFDIHFEADDNAFVSSEELVGALNEFLRARNLGEWSSKLVATRIEQHEGLRSSLGLKIKKDRKRLNDNRYSPRFVVGGNAGTNAVAVWWGLRWSK
jgi:P4 family phage/plasmid primase-like protien